GLTSTAVLPFTRIESVRGVAQAIARKASLAGRFSYPLTPMTLPSPDLSDPTADLYQKAVDAYYAGRFDIASAHVDEILAHTPEHAHAMHLGGLSLLALGDAEAAQRWVARALEVAAEPNFYNTL